jgi:acyl carrier protein
MMGGAGQANYAASNSYLDTYAKQLRNEGMPAKCIQWGAWSEIGMASRLGAAQTKQNSKAIQWIPPALGWSLFEKILREEIVEVGVFKANWKAIAQEQGDLHSSPFLKEVLKNVTLKSQKKSNPALSPWFTQLTQASPEARKSMIQEWLRSKVAQTLGHSNSQKVDLEKPLFDQGLDSLMSVSLRNELKKELGNKMTLKSTLIFDYPNILGLSGYIENKIFESNKNINNKNKKDIEINKEIESMNSSEVSSKIKDEVDELKKLLAE